MKKQSFYGKSFEGVSIFAIESKANTVAESLVKLTEVK
jgi:hypothetical protein